MSARTINLALDGDDSNVSEEITAKFMPPFDNVMVSFSDVASHRNVMHINDNAESLASHDISVP